MIGEAVAAAADRLGSDARAVLARLGGSLGVHARGAAAELEMLAAAPRRRARAASAVTARAPSPRGLRGSHPTWIEAALRELPERARHAVAANGGTEVDVWLARWACAELPPLPSLPPAPPAPPARARWPTSAAEAIELPGELVRAWLERIGADQLALVMASAGKRSNDRAGDRIARPPRAGALGPVRAAIARCQGALPDELAHVRIGARSIAPYFDGLSRRQLIVRLPRPLGLIVEAELAGAARVPIDQCPAWTALAAD